MKLDNEIQRKLLIQITEQAKISGNYVEVRELSKQISDLLETIRKAPLETGETVSHLEKSGKSTKIMS